MIIYKRFIEVRSLFSALKVLIPSLTWVHCALILLKAAKSHVFCTFYTCKCAHWTDEENYCARGNLGPKVRLKAIDSAKSMMSHAVLSNILSIGLIHIDFSIFFFQIE